MDAVLDAGPGDGSTYGLPTILTTPPSYRVTYTQYGNTETVGVDSVRVPIIEAAAATAATTTTTAAAASAAAALKKKAAAAAVADPSRTPVAVDVDAAKRASAKAGRRALQVGLGRIVASEIEVPIELGNLV